MRKTNTRAIYSWFGAFAQQGSLPLYQILYAGSKKCVTRYVLLPALCSRQYFFLRIVLNGKGVRRAIPLKVDKIQNEGN